MVEELTWTCPIHDDITNSKTELRGSQNGKYTTEELVSLGHGVYPEAHLTST